MDKLYAILFGAFSVLLSVFISNERGKAKGKEEEKNKQNKETLKNVKETQDRINKYNSTSMSDIRKFLRNKRENSRNK